jgi:hypothetical protein
MQITYSLEDRIMDGTAESTLPEMVNMKNTNKEKTVHGTEIEVEI